MKVSNDIYYIGVNDYDLDLFEGQYEVPNGMSYNSYLIMDEKIAVLDTVETHFSQWWFDNLQAVLRGRKPDYLIVQHMEPDHSSNIVRFMDKYPEAVVVASSRAFTMMKNFYHENYEKRRMIVTDDDYLVLGKHILRFIEAPMVHWPEVIMTYDERDKVLFSADAFGKFGTLDVDEEWACEARRYYFGIVGKYGAAVRAVLRKTDELDINTICPLHGPMIDDNLDYYLGLYDIWSEFEPESEGIVIAYTSVYGNTRNAVYLLADKLREYGCPEVVINDLARSDLAECVEDSFRYSKTILATTTYNGDMFPIMREFLNRLTERNFQNRTIGFVENGSWKPEATAAMKSMLAGSKNLTFCENDVRILSALNQTCEEQIDRLAREICDDYRFNLKTFDNLSNNRRIIA